MLVFIDVKYEDLARLKPKGWLNDNLIFAGIKCVLSSYLHDYCC
jgi:hypothetical protein